MSVYKYRVLDANKKTITGLVEAVNDNSAIDVLRDKGYVILSLEEKRDMFGVSSLPFLGRVKTKDLVVFSRQFSVLITANIAIVQSLRILVNQTENTRLRLIVAEVADEVDGGSRLSDALGKRNQIFSDFFVNVIRSGETSGKLDEVLNYIAKEMEKDYDMMSKIKGAMYYPAFVLSGMLIVGVIMMVSVVPKLTDVMKETGGELPWMTRLVIAVSDFLVGYWWVLFLIIPAAIYGIVRAGRTPVGKLFFDRAKLRVPVFGRLFSLIYLVRFTRSLNTLLVGGVAISKSLSITADVVSNKVYRDLIIDTIKEVEDGNSISTVFAESPQIPRMVSQMLAIGEETGRLDTILEHITDFYEREVNNIVSNLMSLLEPVIMVVMGVGVGIMVAAIIMPMYNLANTI